MSGIPKKGANGCEVREVNNSIYDKEKCEEQKPMTTEQVLVKIKEEHGKSALRDEQSLLGLFVDYSHNQLRPQANALRTFLDCKGNGRILNLRNAPIQKQQTEYHRLIQEMVRDYNMQEATAADVCAAFWRTAIGTEPPISAVDPVPEQLQQPQVPPAPKPVPADPVLTAEEMFQCGQEYENKRDYAQAAKWYRKAAELGHARAQLNLGFAYENGLGVAKYPVEAVSWFRKAAQQGYAPAQDRMAHCYDKGFGVEKDLVKAIEWCKKACSQDFPGSTRHLQQLEAKLRAEQPELPANHPKPEFDILNNVLMKYNGSTANVTVPGGITRIGAQAFADNKSIRSVTLPDTLIGISKAAFAYCSNLQRVVVPGNVIALNMECFTGCQNLQQLILQSGVQKIIFGEELKSLHALKIEIPDTVRSVTWSPIPDCDRAERMRYSKKIIATEKWISSSHQFFSENPDFQWERGGKWPEPGSLFREPEPTPDSPAPLPKVKEQSPFRRHLDEMEKKERRAFLFGLAGVIMLSLFLILIMIELAMDARTSDVSDRLIGIAIFACYLGITLWRMKRLWQTGFSFHPARGFLSAISKAYSTFAEAIHWFIIITGAASFVFIPMTGPMDDTGDTILGLPAFYIIMVVFFLGLAACSAFHASWHKHKNKD